MKEIKLQNDFVALVDDEDYEYLCQFRWHSAQQKGYTQYAIRHLWRDGKRTTTTMHQDILNPSLGMVSDHINGNGLDNRRSNLRVCTASNNCMNRKPQNGSSVYKGVSLHTKGGKWAARIKTKGKIYNLGHFNSEIEAAVVYNNAATKMFGEFARLNTIQGGRPCR
jgi:hypothetical protein